jgi:hypothetical protein
MLMHQPAFGICRLKLIEKGRDVLEHGPRHLNVFTED